MRIARSAPRTLALLAWVLLATVPPGGTPPTAADPGDPAPSRIVFHTYRWGAVAQIALMKPDGTDFSRLTYTSTWDQCPALSPDGRRIAFESVRDGITNRLMVMNVDGSDQHRLTNLPNEEAHASWSRDGSQIGCSSVYDATMGGGGTYDICVMNADGTNIRRLTTDPAHDMGPQWSPDGSQILFTSLRDGSAQIYVMNADGSDQRRLLHKPGDTATPQWSPDGTRIAYVTPDPVSLHSVIHVMNADTTGDVAVTDSTMDRYGPVWSPDGTRIAFTAEHDGHGEIYSMDPDGSNLVQVTSGTATSMAPHWSLAPLDAQIHVGAETAGHDVRLHWNPSPWPGVLRYDVYRGTIAQEQFPALAGSTSDTTFTDPGCIGTFYYRVRAVRAADQSLYSNEDTITPCMRTASYFAAGNAALAPLAGDFNGDGIPDLAVANGLTEGTVSVLLGQGPGGAGAGTFATPVAYAAGATPSGLVTRDFNEDGIPDLAVANNAVSGTFSVLLGRGTNGAGDGTFAAPVSYAVGLRPTAIAAADVNEDGITDLLITCRSSNAVFVALGQGSNGVGDGTFATASGYAATSLPAAITTGDFDADGITDLAVAGNNGVSILRGLGASGHGNGTFAAAVSCYSGSGATAIATGDFDQDGATDLAVALSNSTGGWVVVLRGLGNGTFAAAPRYAAGAAPVAVTVCDFNGDGVADLVLANRNGGAVSCLPGGSSDGVGDGTFGAPVGIPVGSSPSGLALGDFDEDGLPDLAVTHSTGTNTVALLPEVCESGVPDGLRLLVPDGGQSWTVASEQVLSWEKDRGVVSVDIEVSRDAGERWETIATGLTGTRFTWTVTGPPTGSATALIRIHDPALPSRNDQSGSPFTLATTTDVDGAGREPGELRLEGAFPTPTRGLLSVAFALPDDAPATLELLDIAGRRVAARAVGELGPGRHVAQLARPGTSASGVYFIRLSHGGRRLVTKAILVN